MKNKVKIFFLSRNSAGVVIVEVAVVALVLIFLIVGLIDLSRAMSVQALLTKAAQDGLNLAEKIPGIEIETRSLNPASSSSDLVKYNNFVNARDLVVQEALQIVNTSFITNSNVASAAKLISFTSTDQLAGGMPTGTSATRTYSVAVLRPGESSQYSAYSKSYWLDNPAKCSINSPSCGGSLASSEKWQDALTNYPIMVELKAEVRPILPFVPNLTVRGRAIGYREVSPKGAYAEPLYMPPANVTTTTTRTSTTVTTTRTTTTVKTTTTKTTTTTTQAASATTTTTTTSTGSAPNTYTTTTRTTTTTKTTTTKTVTTTSSTTTTISPCAPGSQVYFDCVFIQGGTFDANCKCIPRGA